MTHPSLPFYRFSPPGRDPHPVREPEEEFPLDDETDLGPATNDRCSGCDADIGEGCDDNCATKREQP